MIWFQALINALLFVLALIGIAPYFSWVAAIAMPLISCASIITCFIFSHRGKVNIAFPIIASVFGVSSVLMVFVLLLLG